MTINNFDINFQAQDLKYRYYIIKKIFLTIKKLELIRKKEFAIAVFNQDYKVFIIYIIVLNVIANNKVYLLKKT